MNTRRLCYVLAKVAYLCAGYGNGRELLRVVETANRAAFTEPQS